MCELVCTADLEILFWRAIVQIRPRKILQNVAMNRCRKFYGRDTPPPLTPPCPRAYEASIPLHYGFMAMPLLESLAGNVCLAENHSCWLQVSYQNHLATFTLVWTTVFRRTQNLDPSRAISQFLWNFYVFTKFFGIRYWPVKYCIFWLVSGSSR